MPYPGVHGAHPNRSGESLSPSKIERYYGWIQPDYGKNAPKKGTIHPIAETNFTPERTRRKKITAKTPTKSDSETSTHPKNDTPSRFDSQTRPAITESGSAAGVGKETDYSPTEPPGNAPP